MTIPHIDNQGNKRWYSDIGDIGSDYLVCHRDDDLPAVEWSNGEKNWYKHGRLHRDNDLPAIIEANGTKRWFLNGELHRENDKPAVEYSNGTKEWYRNGLLHREGNKPAIIKYNGTKEWWFRGKRHRKDGPAVVKGLEIRFLGGKRVVFKSQEQWDKLVAEYEIKQIIEG